MLQHATAAARTLRLAAAALLLAAAPARAQEAESAEVRQEKSACPLRPSACTRLGERALTGDGLPQSANLAAVYFEQACDAEPPDGFACARLGALHLEGRGVERSVEQARTRFKEACAQRVRDGCERLAALDRGRAGRAGGAADDVDAWCAPDDPSCGAPRSDRERTLDRLTARCDEGETAACVSLGRALLEPGPERDPERAASLFERACDADDRQGCAYLAWCHESGAGVEGGKDGARAATLYERSCDAGFAYACASLARLHLLGDGVPRDWPHAVDLGTRACDDGALEGCGVAGSILTHLKYAEHDPARGYALLDRGCKGGDLPSCAWQGVAAALGRGTPRSRARGLELLRRACDGDLAQGCFILGTALADGEDAADREGAIAALDRACRGKVERACELRDELRARRRR